MRAHDLPRLAEKFRQALLASKDLWFAIEVLLSDYEASGRCADARAEGRLPRNPLPRRVRPLTYRRAQEFRPLVEAVAAEHGIAVDDLLGPSQRASLVEVRQEAMWRVRNAGAAQRAVAWSVTAAAVGRSHRTTAIAGVRRFEHRLATDPALRARVAPDARVDPCQ